MLWMACGPGWQGDPVASASGSREVRPADARAVLLQALKETQGLVQVHAADALIACGEKSEVRAVFETKSPLDLTGSFRIGSWRSLAGSAATSDRRAVWSGKIEQVFLDRESRERVAAIESLCKLRFVVAGETLAEVRGFASSCGEADAVFASWALFLAGDRDALARIATALGSTDVVARLRAAYVLRWERATSDVILEKLARCAVREPVNSIAFPFVIGAAFALKADSTLVARWHEQLAELVRQGPSETRAVAGGSLAEAASATELAQFEGLLHDIDPEVRISAARAVLLKARKP